MKAGFMKQMVFKHALLAACFMGSLGSAALADEGSLILPDQVDGSVALLLQGEMGDVAPSDVMQVYVGNPDACCTGKSPIAGRYRVENQLVVFDPAFDFVAGQSYTVRSHEGTLTGFTIGRDNAFIQPEVLAVYPSGADIPENTLRFYIDFSTPMQPHVSMDFITLVGADGTPDDAAFMTFKQELWNQDRTRLTLLMDPGRIKRGVATNTELGPALLAGNSYAIKVGEGWQGAQDQATAPAYEHAFTVSNALRSLPDTELWQFDDPRIMTRDPLVITFDRPFDEQMVRSTITVLDADGYPVRGQITVTNAEQTWRFVPLDVWATEAVHIVVDATLEDVAGNNFSELLDHAVGTQSLSVDQQTITRTLGPTPD